MKQKSLIAFCLVAGLLSFGQPVFADGEPSGLAVASDVVVGRPLCFLATILGSALFVISLPVAAISHSVDKAAHALVGKPAYATFTRPLGDFDSLTEY